MSDSGKTGNHAMRDIRRWALYFAPPARGPLARFGADWLGWDAQAGRARAGMDLAGLPRPWDEITVGPRKYGFHATLKAPFPLAADRDPVALDAAITALAADFAPFSLMLRLDALGPFLALVPAAPCAEIGALAEACVTRLDVFRGPSDAAERALRAASIRDEQQRRNLERWGYPFVLEDFRFHMSLTGALDPVERAAVARALAPVVAPLVGTPVSVEDICLFGEDREGMFHLLKRFPLGPAA